MSEQLDAVRKAVKSVAVMTKLPPDGHRPSQAKKLRNRHHTIARMVAAEVPRERICQAMGLTWNTLDLLIEQTPAFQELVVKYRGMPPMPELEGFHSLLERCMIAAELEIADRLLEDPEKFSISELHKVSRDAADRLGYSKHSVNLNVNITLAERLEGLRRRNRAPAGAGDSGGVLSAVPSSPRSAPPLLDLKAASETIYPSNTTRRVPPPPDPVLAASASRLEPPKVRDYTKPVAPAKEELIRRI